MPRLGGTVLRGSGLGTSLGGNACSRWNWGPEAPSTSLWHVGLAVLPLRFCPEKSGSCPQGLAWQAGVPDTAPLSAPPNTETEVERLDRGEAAGAPPARGLLPRSPSCPGLGCPDPSFPQVCAALRVQEQRARECPGPGWKPSPGFRRLLVCGLGFLGWEWEDSNCRRGRGDGAEAGPRVGPRGQQAAV